MCSTWISPHPPFTTAAKMLRCAAVPQCNTYRGRVARAKETARNGKTDNDADVGDDDVYDDVDGDADDALFNSKMLGQNKR